MSPYYFDSYDPWNTGRYHDFGRVFHPHDLSSARHMGMDLWNPNGYRRNWHLAGNRQCPRYEDNGQQSKQLSCVMGSEGFQVCVDVHQFAPKEITVKSVGNSVVIEGKHEERPDDHGYIQRHFVRRYTLPDTHDIDQVQTTLSSDGVLTVKAPTKNAAIKGNEKAIPIQHTGPVHLSVKSTVDQSTSANGTANGVTN